MLLPLLLAASLSLLTGVSMSEKKPAAAPSPTTFTVSMPRPETHLYEISVSISPMGQPVTSFELVLPVWTPGSYAVRDFARNVRDLVVSDSRGRTLAIEKVEKSRWRVRTAQGLDAGPFTARYRVYANELSVRTSHLDATHGYGNGASLFLYVEGRKSEPYGLRFDLPAAWRVSIALPETKGVFRAVDYDELVDSPFECGTHRTYEFTVRGKPHTLALWGSGNEDPERLVKDLSRIVETSAAIFGGLPYERYLFLVHISAGGGGGLEHRASQSDGVAPWRFKPEKSYRDVLLLFSHEFFHCWNVKRIHPAVLGPFDYTREVYTRDLWAMEGVTSYYEGLILVRAGLIQPKHLFEEWGKDLKAHRENPGTEVQSAEASSFDAWIRFYHPDENSPNVSESYYRRGTLVGLALDVMIRRETRGKRSLDDVLVSLYREYGAHGVGYPEGAYERTVAEVLGDRAPEGKVFFDRYVRGVETPPFETLLPAMGVLLTEKGEKDEDEKEAEERNGNGNGDAHKEKDKDAVPVKSKSDFGWKTKSDGAKLLVSEIYSGRAAYSAGINSGDELVALDHVRADEDQLKRIERDVPPGTKVTVSLFRRARLIEVPVVLGIRRQFTYQLKADEKASPEARALYAAWLEQPFPDKPKAKSESGAHERVTGEKLE
ncbi:MAG: M61 family peptidase [Thermoanaerobaculia bacterium]